MNFLKRSEGETVLAQRARRNWWKLSVFEEFKNGKGAGFVVKMTGIPNEKEARFLADINAKDGLFVRVSKHINPKHEYYYGK